MTTETDVPDEVFPQEIPEEFASLVAWAKGLKEKAVARPPDDPGDIEWAVTWYRDDQIVAHGIADRVDRDRGLQMCAIGIQGFEADMVEMAMDAHMTDQRFEERYGRLPDPGELQQLCDNEGACEIGLTTDCIVANRMWRDGHTVMISLPYHVDRRRQELEFLTKAKAKKHMRSHDDVVRERDRYYRQQRWTHWIDDRISVLDDRISDKFRITGRVYDNMRASFEAPSLVQRAAEEGISAEEYGLDPQRARWHMDMAVVRNLSMAGFLVAVATQDEEHEELVRQSMARSTNTKMFAMDGAEIDLSAERADMDIMEHIAGLESDLLGQEFRERLDKAAREARADDEAEAERRRATRVGGAATEADRQRMEKEHAHWKPAGED